MPLLPLDECVDKCRIKEKGHKSRNQQNYEPGVDDGSGNGEQGRIGRKSQ